ncbi:MAG: PhnD/SsuA/transferrin family substrate-binding protein [Pseudomonadota bacterium]
MVCALRRLHWLYCLMLAASTATLAEPLPLRLGVMPHLGTPLATARYQPLQSYLQEKLQRPVELHTAPDQKTFVEHIQRGDYGLIVVPPHLARLAQRESGYQALAASRAEITAVVVVDKNHPLQQLAELRGTTVTLPDRLSLVSMLGLDLIAAQQLQAGRDYQLAEFPLHISAVLAVTQGKAGAAITSWKTLNRMPVAVKEAVHIAAQSQPVPDAIYLAHPAASGGTGTQLQQLLDDFMRTAAGQQFAEITGHSGLRPLGNRELERYDDYATQLKSGLGDSI